MDGVSSEGSTVENLLPADRTLQGEDRRLFAMDVYRAKALPRAVLRPETVDELQRIVVAAAAEKLALVTRGGGVSYTDGYLPTTEQSVLIDTGALNRILDINTEDMCVTVEPGITWEKLHAALAPHGVKVPFVGTFSGLAATVGGGVSQNSNGLGSNAGGISADSVLAIEVLTARGDFVRAGLTSSGKDKSKPFFRNYGPDLVGLFTGDCGALGIKTAISLKLVRRKPAFETASFGFPDFQSLHRAMAAIAAERIEEKSFGLDLALSQGQIAKQDAGSQLTVAKNVWQSSPNAISALRQLTRMALAGKRVLAAAPYAAHYIIEGHRQTETRGRLAALRDIASRYGSELPNSVPAVVQAMPFQPLHNMLGPNGERWVPLHGLFRHSAVADFHQALTAYVASHAAEMARHRVHHGLMFSCIGASTFLYEPALYWQDARTIFHNQMMDPSYLAKVPDYPANPEGAALVERIRTEMIELMHAHGAAHLQIGKLYPYVQDNDPGAMSLLRAIKRELDPDNLLNPGALGL